jgi:CRISPR-associated exonuclease Cas4
VVEFHRQDNRIWQPYPVEYKRGKPKENRCDEVQLCAQALCLEEMLSTSIPEGALFYGKTKHRTIVLFDESLKRLTAEICTKTHELLRQEQSPPAFYEKAKCFNCSLVNLCLPKISEKNVSQYISSMLSEEAPI